MWFEIITTAYAGLWKHYLTLVLITANAAFYFKYYRLAIVLTGIILILAVFNLLTFFTIEKTTSWQIRIGNTRISTPEIQLISLLLFVVYFIINFDILTKWYLDMKEKKANTTKHS